MQGIEILYWALSTLFCLALTFAILLWCRSWRKEEREQTARQIGVLSGHINRLAALVESLEQTSAALQTADEQLSGEVQDLRNAVKQVQQVRPVPAPSGVVLRRDPEPIRPESPAPVQSPDEGGEADRYARARTLLQQGRPAVDVARRLDLGTAEVRMIARILELESSDAEPGQQADKNPASNSTT